MSWRVESLTRWSAQRIGVVLLPDVLVAGDRKDRASLRRAKPNFLAADVPRLELRRRRASWQPEFFRLENNISLESVDLPLPVAQLYRRVNMRRGGQAAPFEFTLYPSKWTTETRNDQSTRRR